MSAELAQHDLDLGGGRPGDLGWVIRRNPETGARQMDRLEWGLLPHDTLDPATAPRPTHARAETIATKPMFADAFRRRRAIVPADLFYQKDSRGRRYAISRRDGKPLAFAALWESYRRSDGRVTRSYCVITVPADEVVAPFHDRMPLVLEEQDFAVWLSEVPGAPEALLRPSARDVLICRATRRS